MRADARTGCLALAALAALGLAACAGPESARAIDRICKTIVTGGPACEIDGAGLETPGPTDDSVGFTLDDARLVVHLVAVPEVLGPGRFDVSLLTGARQPDSQIDTALTWGSCGAGCPADPSTTVRTLPNELGWVTVASGLHASSADAKVPYDAVMAFTGFGVFVVDLRVTPTP
jgi:hypothetical protein